MHDRGDDVMKLLGDGAKEEARNFLSAADPSFHSIGAAHEWRLHPLLGGCMLHEWCSQGKRRGLFVLQDGQQQSHLAITYRATEPLPQLCSSDVLVTYHESFQSGIRFRSGTIASPSRPAVHGISRACDAGPIHLVRSCTVMSEDHG